MSFKFLRQDGWFQVPSPADMGVSTSTTTGVFFTATLATSVNLSTSAFADGPTVAQGTTGVWFATGTVSITGQTASDACILKLWDGTTVMAETIWVVGTGAGTQAATLTGIITNPAGNIKISGICGAGGSGAFIGTNTAAGAGSTGPYNTITAVRIG